jgi:hypothetical protein
MMYSLKMSYEAAKAKLHKAIWDIEYSKYYHVEIRRR